MFQTLNLAGKVGRVLAQSLATLGLLSLWFVGGWCFTAVCVGTLQNLLFWLTGISLERKFCLWLATFVGPYDTLIDPLPFYFVVGSSGGALATMLKIRALMSNSTT